MVSRSDISLVAHLMRRAGFGATRPELEDLAAQGYEKVVDDLLNPDRFPRVEEDILERHHAEHADEESPRWAAMKWMYRMVNSPRPLEEKIALFWHGVFATGWAKVTNGPMMYRHYSMLRDYGLGNFGTLLRQLSRDTAMIYWLDQQTNHAEAVNENYGRELLELFSMGRGNYTEDDVRNCARAFTGWTMTQVLPRYPTGYWPADFVYREDDHDDGEKEFLGEVGNFNGDDVIEIIIRQPATAAFIGKEVHSFFVADDPDDDEVQLIAQAYEDSGHEIREVLRFVFNSDFFKNSQFRKVKSPAEFVANTVRLSGRHTDGYERGLSALPRATLAMGQELLNPPTVEGWHTGREWIDSSFLVSRVNFAAERLNDRSAPGVAAMAERASAGEGPVTVDELLDTCLYEMGSLRLGNPSREIILKELGIEDRIPRETQEEKEEARRIAGQLVGMIATSREYQFA